MSTVQSDDRAWVVQILDQLAAHVQSEEEMLGEYTAAVATVDEPDVRYLIQLILEDEARHHRVFEEIVHAVRGSVRWEHIEPKVPDRSRSPLPEELRQLTARFLAAEREDRRHLRSLRQRLEPVANTTLWPLLVQLMELDTDKHLLILESLAGRSSG